MDRASIGLAEDDVGPLVTTPLAGVDADGQVLEAVGVDVADERSRGPAHAVPSGAVDEVAVIRSEVIDVYPLGQRGEHDPDLGVRAIPRDDEIV
ncbi:MAG TPA: hypothetical protein VIG64_14280 [Actinomycetota bacterium]|jgi:hypothetical protein